MKQMPKGILEIKNFPKEINYLTFPERLKITPSAYFKYNQDGIFQQIMACTKRMLPGRKTNLGF